MQSEENKQEGAFEFNSISAAANTASSDVMRKTLDGKLYVAGKAPELADSIGNLVLERLRELSPNFKFIVSACILQKVGAGLHVASTSFWDAKTDGMITTKYENDSIICICTVIGVSI